MNRLLNKYEKERVVELFSESLSLSLIIQDFDRKGGRAFLVGGAVRDLLLHKEMKDIDIEVHGIPFDDLKETLHRYGCANYVGKSFGVVKFKDSLQSSVEIDFSLPRTDSIGRKPEVRVNPDMDIADALRRRDLTINALAVDLVKYELYDPFLGEKDLDSNILRSPDTTFFTQDPLRFFRVMQFIGRFEMYPDDELQQVCLQMDISTISRERIEQEFTKLFLLSLEPSRGLRWLKDAGRLKEILPELFTTIGCEQSRTWHPEGDVFEHTMQVVDAAAQIARRESLNQEDYLVLVYAALCHDLGKPITTQKHEDGRITSYLHEKKGVSSARSLLQRICGTKCVIKTVEKLVRWHMAPGGYIKSGAKKPAYKRLALRLAPETTMQMLAWLSEADKRGRNGESLKPLSGPIESVELFVQCAQQCGVLYHPEEPIIKGEDLLDVFDPGPQLGKAVKHAYEIQINEGIRDKNTLKKRVI